MGGLALGMGLLGGGSVLSGLGGMIGAASGNRAGREARDWYDMRTGEGSGRYGIGGFGFDPWNDLVLASQYTQGTPEQRAAAAGRFSSSTGGSVLDQLRGLEDFSMAEGGNIVSGFGGDTRRLRGIADSHAGSLNTGHRNAMNTTLGDFDRGSQGVLQQINDFGRGREKIIDEDAADAERDANDRSAIALTSAGLGNSTALANQYSANAAEKARTVARAKQDLGDAQIGLKTSVGTAQNNQRAGLQSNLFSQALGALERGNAGIMDLESNRSAGSTNLYEQAVDRNLQFKLMRPNTILSMLGSGPLNPWQGQSTSQYYPGYSGAGSALTNVGNSTAGIGSLLTLQNMFGGGGGQDENLRKIWK